MLAELLLLTYRCFNFIEGVANLDSDSNEIDGTDEHNPNGGVSSGQRPKLQNSIAGK